MKAEEHQATTMWGAVKRIFIAELYTRFTICLLLAVLGTIGLSIAGHPSFALTALGFTLMAVVYRLKFGRW